MNPTLLTPHARVRMQQRGIRSDALGALLDFGAERHVQDGREIVFLDKRARAKLARNGPGGARGTSNGIIRGCRARSWTNPAST